MNFYIPFGIVLLIASLQTSSCGRSGKGSGTSSSSAANLVNISGTIVSQTGGQREMAGWIVAIIEKGTNSARVAEVDQAGGFSFTAVNQSSFQTIALLNSDFKLSAVLSMDVGVAGKIGQFFKVSSNVLPRLVHKGSTVEFFSTSDFTLDTSYATDTDQDRIPDGMESPSLTLTNEEEEAIKFELQPSIQKNSIDQQEVYSLSSTNKTDTDGDGIINSEDPDIDGDGLVNAIDTDIDNDGVLNVFDADANGNGVVDVSEKQGAQYFSETVEYIATQLIVEPQIDGTNLLSMILSVKVRNNITPDSVSVRGPAALLNGATVSVVDQASGAVLTQNFDSKLNDDGLSNDGTSGDRVYAKKVSLSSGKTPKANQIIYFQVNLKNGSTTYAREYAYVLPSITLGSVSASYDSSLSKITILGTPFGTISDYYWSADVYTAAGTKVTSTPVTVGSNSSFQLATDLLNPGTSYSAIVNAQSLDPIPGYPAYLVRSLSTNIQ